MLFKPFERTLAHPLLSGSLGTLAIGVLLIPSAGKITAGFWFSEGAIRGDQLDSAGPGALRSSPLRVNAYSAE